MQLQQQKKKYKLKRILFNSFLFFLLPSFLHGQNDSIEKYIPYSENPIEEHPEITIRVNVHIIKRYYDDPQNITEDSVEYLNRMFIWINNMYRNMTQPTLSAKDGNKYFVPDSRIRFRLDKISAYTDSSDWDRIRTNIFMNLGAPWTIDTINLSTNEVGFKGGSARLINNNGDSLKIVSSNGNDGIYYRIKARNENGITFIELKQNLKNATPGGKISYFTKQDRNCSKDIWEKYTNSDQNALHIFYTGSSRVGNGFGCGPSPYFLNVSNVHVSGGYAVAQLSGHELGHCIGLSHSNFPQFDDLPATDKFGWIDCNEINTSNNIMGYNMCRNYLSPKQIGYVHKRYSTNPDLIKTTTANEYDTVYNIEVWENAIWNKAMVIKGDVIVRKKQTLEINYPIHMADGAGIYVERGAKVVINGTTITNYFEGSYWRGIVICKSYRRKNKVPKKNIGMVVLNNGGTIEKVTTFQQEMIPHWKID